MSLSLTLLGNGTPAPLYHRSGSSYLVTLNGERFLFDCGPGSVRRLLQKGISPTEINTLFLTHLHYDHCVDYGYLVLSRWDQGVGQIPELTVYGPGPITRTTDLLFGETGVYGPDLAGRTQHPGSQFVFEMRGGTLPRKRPAPNVTEVDDGTVVETDKWQLQVIEVVHNQPQLTCLAYRFETNDGVLIFSGDTGPIDALTQLAKGADVLVHMCHIINGVVTDPRITKGCSGHLDAATTARDAGVTTLVLVHITEQLEQPGIRERILFEAGQIYDGQIIFGEDLLDIPVGQITPQKIR
jgi:ribonuclease BN (tRNA processing enzyme)